MDEIRKILNRIEATALSTDKEARWIAAGLAAMLVVFILFSLAIYFQVQENRSAIIDLGAKLEAVNFSMKNPIMRR